MKEKKVTIREVAALAGVSISSVSRYLKDPKSVQPLAAYNIKNAIKEAISKEDIDEKYIRDFLNCSIIDRNSKEINLDKIMFIYKYGSKKAKQIAVDEKLKMM